MFSIETIEHLADTYSVEKLIPMRLQTNFPQDHYYDDYLFASKMIYLLQTKILAHYMSIVGE